MELFLLYFDAFFNLATFVLGIILIFRAHDNRIRLWWGVIMLLMGIVLLYGSVEWIRIYVFENFVYSDNHYGLLRWTPMIKGFTVAAVMSLFPLSSLRPAYLTRVKFVVFFIPVLIVILIAVCYNLFNGKFTEVHDFKGIVLNISEQDIQVRLFLFGFILIILLSYFFIPVLSDWTSARRRATRFMHIFIASLFFMLAYYIAYTIFENSFVFYTASMANTIPCIIFSVYFLLYENPFSYRITGGKNENVNQETFVINVLFEKMQTHFQTQYSFVNQTYRLIDLANEMHTSQTVVVKAIKAAGFTGFREYMNFLRIQHFKVLAKADPQKSIKELMYGCGFSSRSAFYRIFSESEQTTPSEFVAKLNLKS